MKNKLLLLALGIALTTQTLLAQVPSYVPTNGLVGYWPFNGNANDESGNGNNGTVNGATLTTDRFGNTNSAYSFDGVNDVIKVNDNPSFSFLLNDSFSINIWFEVNSFLTNGNEASRFISQGDGDTAGQNRFWEVYLSSTNPNLIEGSFRGNVEPNEVHVGTPFTQNNTWVMVTMIRNYNNDFKLYINGILVDTEIDSAGLANPFSQQRDIYFGAIKSIQDQFRGYYQGKLDDTGIWNRALNQQEITNLYNSVNSNECLTMIINTGPLNTTPVTYTSTVNIYPNPANDHITIDCGNLANVQGWSIKITNMLGQEVFNQPMNTQQYYVPLNTWTGQGMYFVKIINAQNEVVNIKKIILQ